MKWIILLIAAVLLVSAQRSYALNKGPISTGPGTGILPTGN
jgi:hypothetical protein